MKSILVILLVLMGYLLSAQSEVVSDVKVLSLEECMTIALENNIALKRVQNNARMADANYFQSMMNYLPSVSMSANYDLYNGTFWDQSAARQVTAVTNTSNPGIRASWTVFNGFYNHHYRNATYQLKNASEFAIEEQKQNLESNVLTAYLNVVLDKENIKIAKDRIKLLEAQLQREKRRTEVGVGNLEQVYNFQSQLANEKLGLVNFSNALMTDKLRLLQILQLEITQEYDIAPYEFVSDDALLDKAGFASVLDASLTNAPSIKRATANVESAKYNFKAAKSQYYPTVTASGSVGSFYSSNGATNPENGTPDLNASFADQMEWNKFNYVNVSVSVPIFSNWENRNTSQVAKLTMENAYLDLKQNELDMTNTVQQVYVNLISAQETYKAAKENLTALNQSYEYAKTRYESGSTDFYTYLESLNNKNRAEIESVNAKYNIVFRKKILDVYRGTL